LPPRKHEKTTVVVGDLVRVVAALRDSDDVRREEDLMVEEEVRDTTTSPDSRDQVHPGGLKTNLVLGLRLLLLVGLLSLTYNHERSLLKRLE
jgi:hypothetical protein